MAGPKVPSEVQEILFSIPVRAAKPAPAALSAPSGEHVFFRSFASLYERASLSPPPPPASTPHVLVGTLLVIHSHYHYLPHSHSQQYTRDQERQPNPFRTGLPPGKASSQSHPPSLSTCPHHCRRTPSLPQPLSGTQGAGCSTPPRGHCP